MKTKFDNDIMMASLFANATEGIVLANRAGEIVLANPCAEKMFGFPKEEMIGQRIEILLPDDIREKHVHHRESFHQHPVNRSMGAGRTSRRPVVRSSSIPTNRSRRSCG